MFQHTPFRSTRTRHRWVALASGFASLLAASTSQSVTMLLRDGSGAVQEQQLQLATLFALRGDEDRARRICRDLAGERMLRLQRLCVALENERRPQYWELNERGVNFAYLPPERRAQLPKLMGWIDAYQQNAASNTRSV